MPAKGRGKLWFIVSIRGLDDPLRVKTDNPHDAIRLGEDWIRSQIDPRQYQLLMVYVDPVQPDA